MFCPNCKRDTDLSEGSSQLGRAELLDKIVKVRSVTTDLCAECYRPLREAVLVAERDLGEVKLLQGHLSHAWTVEALSVQRLAVQEGYIKLKIRFGITCGCGQLSDFEDELTTLGPFKLLP